jgi:hypothetical protein
MRCSEPGVGASAFVRLRRDKLIAIVVSLISRAVAQAKAAAPDR